ncbi:TrfB-related DNA-binding protein [Thiothrix fructosivorans]|uniref:TrfB transcriptional repressor protein domain-containing protein n=1 Tax=Thiothrix fructosivorans TaxID=111770 RepID=A0A8B0SL08_9GAMM|nr:TrfB-related DNA-binding protein [Thiothrix fructosivorans]MBO0611491.1 hypothetical protein [Thiothrix fructosivorans]QTX12953.1 hypothetical protein J1836_020520 [Thiothrix fructosivorans]
MVSSRLSAENFRQAVGTLKRFGERPQQAAWRVLVKGETLEMAAVALSISKEAVRKSVGRVTNAWRTMHLSEMEAVRERAIGLMREAMRLLPIPEGWEPVVVYLPRSMTKTIRELETQQLATVQKGMHSDQQLNKQPTANS